ncbi:hypothetical protein BGZ80_009085 [Entomortierella chlamydospora]|uniref:Inositol polyphosphate-related phosphatase domain-containing protein n=1 Tax=Entomortierella chlamydospora TaxID=101097 RepID=A0A9P6MY19_9FUNG|nr:hypothetical protein BGZ80_009085 [Entomortierella chlamydospora]
MDPSNNYNNNSNTNGSTRAPPPPIPPARRPNLIAPGTTPNPNSTAANPTSSTPANPASNTTKTLAPSPPPKPSSLSPLPPRKPISFAATAIAAIAANSLSSPTSRLSAHNNNNNNNNNNNATSPSIIAASSPLQATPHTFQAANGVSPTSGSSTNSPSTAHVPSFSAASSGVGTAPLRSQTIPVSPSFLRSNSSATFSPAAASSSIAAKQQLLLNQQQQQPHDTNGQETEESHQEDPFSDINNITATTATAPANHTLAAPRPQNQSSLLTARLQGVSTSPSLHAPVPQYGSYSNSSRAVSSPPPASVPSLPPRTRNTGTPIPGRQNTFSSPQRHATVQPMPPSFPGQTHAISSSSQPAPPPPRRASVQLAAQSTTTQQQPRGPSPHFSASGESNASRFRNLAAPQQAFDHASPQPKRIFPTSSSSATSYATATSPIPERGFANMELSDSQSDSDETSDDSDKEYDDEEYLPPMASNPFANSVDASSRPTRARTFVESPTPPSLPARPLSKLPPPRQPNIISDQDVVPGLPPALPPKPAIRRRPLPSQDAGSFIDSESDPHSIHSYPGLPIGSGPSYTDGVFPDYSRSNRRLPLFSDVIGIHDIQQKSHGVRAFSISNEQVATATSTIRVYSVFTGHNISSYSHEKDAKPSALLFTQSRRPESLGQYLWAGWSEGSLQIIDTKTMEVVEKKRAAHKGGCITQIIRNKSQVWTVDDAGTVFVWGEDTMLCRPTIHTPVLSLTIPPKQVCAIAVQDMLWSSDGTKINVVRVGPDAGRPKLSPTSMEIPFGIGPLTCMATIAGSGQVFSGHEDGKVIIWSIESRDKIRIINVHAYRIMSLLGVGSYLWAGFTTGKIYVLDLRPDVPVVMKDWQAHKDSGVAMLQLDEEGLILGSRHQVGSCAESGEIKIWDGLMARDRLTKGMVDRSKEYCQWRDLKVLICSWNIDASKPAAQEINGGADRKLFEQWLTSMDQEGPPDIISVGFQEIVDLESKKMTAKSLLKGSKRAETETVSKQYKRWQIFLTDKIRELYKPMGVNFRLLECSNLVGLFSCVFVRDKEWENVRSDWTHVDMVKTGLKGFHGNKGGIATRLIIDDTSISFVNCHLAAGQSHTRQRNTDAANVLKKLCHPNPTISSEIVHPEVFWFGDGTMAMDHEACFLSGDLNYRIDVKFSDAVSRVQSQDWSYLHQHDQLLQQKQRNPQFVLRAFNESELRFAPTYKYDPGTDTYDTSSKHRTPAWCDRILWRGINVRQLFYKRSECRVSDHRPISGGFVVGVKRINEAQRQVVEHQVKEGWLKVQEKEIRIKKLAWLRSWGWTDARVEGILDREGGDLSQVVRVLTGE